MLGFSQIKLAPNNLRSFFFFILRFTKRETFKKLTKLAKKFKFQFEGRIKIVLNCDYFFFKTMMLFFREIIFKMFLNILLLSFPFKTDQKILWWRRKSKIEINKLTLSENFLFWKNNNTTIYSCLTLRQKQPELNFTSMKKDYAIYVFPPDRKERAGLGHEWAETEPGPNTTLRLEAQQSTVA